MNKSFKNAVSKIFQNQHAFTALMSVCVGSGITKTPTLNLINLFLARLDASNAIYPDGQKPSNRVKGKIRTLYLIILFVAAHHQFHHSPLTPFMKFRDSNGNPIFPKTSTKPRHMKTPKEREADDKHAAEERNTPSTEGKGGSLDYKPFDVRDILLVQTELAPSTTAALHAISAIVMDERIAVHQILRKLLLKDGLDVTKIRQAVRQLDEKRSIYYKLMGDSSAHKIDPMQKIPYFKRPANHFTKALIYSSGHHTNEDIDPATGELIVDNPEFNKYFVEKMRSIFKTKKIFEYHDALMLKKGPKPAIVREDHALAKAEFEYALTTSWGIRMRPDQYVKGDGIVRVGMFDPKAFTKPENIRVIGNDIPFVPPRNSSKSMLGFRPGTNPYAQYGVKPILDFTLTTDSVTGKTQGRVDELVFCLSDIGELTKAISGILRTQVASVSEKDPSVDSTFLSGACQAICFELPRPKPVDVELLPTSIEELASYYSPDYLASCERESVHILREINTDDQGSIYGSAVSAAPVMTGGRNNNNFSRAQTPASDSNSNHAFGSDGGNSRANTNQTLPVQGDSYGNYRASGGQPQVKKNRVFALNLMFCMMTPEALGEILIKTCTSKFTLPRKNIPLLCPDPNKPCSFLAVDVVPGNAENISTMRVSSDKNTFTAMQNMIIDMEKKKATRTGVSVLEEGQENDEPDQTEITEDDIPLEEVTDGDNPFINQMDEEVFFTKKWNESIGFMDPDLPNCPYNKIEALRDYVQDIRAQMGPKESHITVSPVKGGVIDKVLEDALKGSSSKLKKAAATNVGQATVVVNHGFANQRASAPPVAATPIPTTSAPSGTFSPQPSGVQHYQNQSAPFDPNVVPEAPAFNTIAAATATTTSNSSAPSLYSQLGIPIAKSTKRPLASVVRIPSMLAQGIVHPGNRNPIAPGGIMTISGMEYATVDSPGGDPNASNASSPEDNGENYPSNVGSPSTPGTPGTPGTPATPQAFPSTSQVGLSWKNATPDQMQNILNLQYQLQQQTQMLMLQQQQFQQQHQQSPMSARVPDINNPQTTPVGQSNAERRLSPDELRRKQFAANFNKQQQPKAQSPPAEYSYDDQDQDVAIDNEACYADEDWALDQEFP
jgi:hypothetical protein